jgi:hypothetical protein
MLTGHYVKQHGGTVQYYDLNTGDNTFPVSDVYLIGYWEDWVETIVWPKNCTVIDPWRRIVPSNNYYTVHYGNTRR